MLNRVQVFRKCQIVLLAGLMLGACVAVSAQSAANAPTQPAQAATASKTQSAPAPLNFKDIVEMIQRDGDFTNISRYIAQGLGLEDYSIGADSNFTMQYVRALVLADPVGHRQIFLINDTHAVLFITKAGPVPMMYLTNSDGVLQKASQPKTSRLGTESFKDISLKEAASGFATEKAFWMRQVPASKADAATN